MLLSVCVDHDQLLQVYSRDEEWKLKRLAKIKNTLGMAFRKYLATLFYFRLLHDVLILSLLRR